MKLCFLLQTTKFKCSEKRIPHSTLPTTQQIVHSTIIKMIGSILPGLSTAFLLLNTQSIQALNPNYNHHNPNRHHRHDDYTKLSMTVPPLSSIANDARSSGGERFGRRKFVGAVLGTVTSLVGAGEVYSRSGGGGNFHTPLTNPIATRGWEDIDEVTLIFHGAGGPDAYTDELLKKLAVENQKLENTYYAMIDWSEYSQNTLQASFNGQKIGIRTANNLFQNAPNLKSLHIIGISVGAFAADACVQQFKKLSSPSDKNNNPVMNAFLKANNNNESPSPSSTSTYTQLTLLDPFCARGVTGLLYGANQFGKSADYAQQFFNTDDPVPSTNAALPRCACTDVTNVRPSAIFGHDWPLVYFTRHSETIGMVPFVNQRPQGSICTINSLS